MRIEFQARSARRLSMTPLIDVVFLLLLFFMLSSVFTRFAEIELSAGDAGGAARATPDVIATFAPLAWRINGDTVPVTDLPSHLQSLRAADASSVLLMVETDRTSQELASAIERLRRAGFSVSVAR